MFFLDKRIPLGMRRQFANEIKHLPEVLKLHLQSCLQGNESEEFYAGLLAGLTTATTLLQTGNSNLIESVTAIVADYAEHGELTP